MPAFIFYPFFCRCRPFRAVLFFYAFLPCNQTSSIAHVYLRVELTIYYIFTICRQSHNDITTVTTITTPGGQPRWHPGDNRTVGLQRPVRGIQLRRYECPPGYGTVVSVGSLEHRKKNTHLKGPTATSTSHFVFFKAIGQCAKTPKSNKKVIKTFDRTVRSTTLTVALKEGIVVSTALVLDVEAFKSSAVPSWSIISITTGYFVLMTFSWVRSWDMDAQ